MTTGAGSVSALAGLQQCEDFIQFEQALRVARGVDDKIIQALNNVLPNQSRRVREEVDPAGKCKELWTGIETNYLKRGKAISKCIAYTEEKIEHLRQNGDRAGVRQRKTTLHLLESEQGVEEVVRNRTKKAFHEKCRDYYSPEAGGW